MSPVKKKSGRRKKRPRPRRKPGRRQLWRPPKEAKKITGGTITLKDAILHRNVTIPMLAQRTGISRKCIWEYSVRRRTVVVERAIKLARELGFLVEDIDWSKQAQAQGVASDVEVGEG